MPGLRLQQWEDEQEADAGGEGRLIRAGSCGVVLGLQEALTFQESQGLLVVDPGAGSRAVTVLLILQGQLPLRPPEAAQGIEAVLQEPGVGVALIAADGAQTLGQFGRVLGFEGQELKR